MFCRIRRHLLVLIPLVICLPCCGDDNGAKPEEEQGGYPAAITISQAIENFLNSWREMNLEEYGKLLHESFVFVFDPNDVGEETGFKDRWPRDDDLESTENIFSGRPDKENRVTQRITMAFQSQDAEISPIDPSWKRVVLTQFALELEAVDGDDGQTWFLRTTGGYEVYLHFVLTEEIDPETNAPLWKIVMIEDKPPPIGSQVSAVEESSWGSIKANYR